MKKICLPLLGLAMLAAGCSSDNAPELLSPMEITVDLADITFSRGTSLQGGLENADGENIVFNLLVMTNESGSSQTPVLYAKKVTTVSGGSVGDVKFDVQLVPGCSYKICCYAGFEKGNGLNTAEEVTLTGAMDAMKNIAGTYSFNNEKADIFYAEKEVSAAANASVAISLTRPLAKIVIVNTGTALPASATISGSLTGAYSLTNPFNALTGTFSSTELTPSTLASTPISSGYTDSEGEQTVGVLYVPVAASETGEDGVALTLKITDGEKSVEKNITGMTIKRNYLTVIKGNLSL